MAANPYRPLSRLRDGGAVPALFLLGSHALATWGVRTWEFSVALILMALWPTSLALVAAYGIIDSLACIILGVGDCLHFSPSSLGEFLGMPPFPSPILDSRDCAFVLVRSPASFLGVGDCCILRILYCLGMTLPYPEDAMSRGCNTVLPWDDPPIS